MFPFREKRIQAFREVFALHMAVKIGNVAAVEEILLKASDDHAIDVNRIVDKSGFTAVYYAFRSNRYGERIFFSQKLIYFF